MAAVPPGVALGRWHSPPLPRTVSPHPIHKSLWVHPLRGEATTSVSPERPLLSSDAGKGWSHERHGAAGRTEPMEVTMQPTEQQKAHNRLAPSGNGRTEVAYTLDSQVVADLGGTRILDEGDARSQQPRKPRPRVRRRLVIGLVVAAVLWAGHSYGVPYVREMLETVETDDAFVAGHITYVSPRIEDVVTEVLVDQNDRVEPGSSW